MLALNPLKLHRSARIGNKSAQTLLRYLENPEMFLWVNLIGGTAANFFSVYILMVTFYRYPKPYFLLIILVCLVALYFV
ncbi:MAG: CNNM domain-containing protein, partial [Bacilli bacterium]